MKNLELSLEFSEVEKEASYKYSKKTIKEFEEILNTENEKDIFLFLVSKNILLTDFGGDFSSISDMMKKLDLTKLDEFFKLNIIQKRFDFIRNNLLKNKDFYIDYINLSIKNPSKQKGSAHFSKKVKKHFSKYINVEIIDSLIDFKLKDNTIYVSSSDKILTNVLKLHNFENIPKKGIDIIMNVNNNLSFGEVKEINATGGTQNLQYDNLEEIANHEDGFGIIYGNILFHENTIKKRAIANPNVYTIWEFKDLIS